ISPYSFTYPAISVIYTLSLHDALPISNPPLKTLFSGAIFQKATEKLGLHPFPLPASNASEPITNPYGVRIGPCNYCGYCEDFGRSEEHTSELQSRFDLVCRLLLEKKK